MEANRKFKSPETAMHAAAEFFKEKFEYKGKIGIEKYKPGAITLYAKDDPKIEESFSAQLVVARNEAI